MRIKEQMAGYAGLIEQALPSYLPECPEPEKRVADAMRYSLLSGGKRVRGMLLLAFYKLFQEDVCPALPFAGAVEMVHAYSLIHDDLPCMDNDDMRRGKPSCHIAFDEATALLAGDGLLTLAFETITAPQYTEPFSPQAVLDCVRALSGAAGCRGMIGGQMIDLLQEGGEPDATLLARTYAKKTGVLLQAPAEIACILAGADETIRKAAIAYSGDLGLAFQIVDDILDVEGDEDVLGKPTGSDRGNDKQTYVRLYGLEAAREEVGRLTMSAKQALQALDADTRFLEGLVAGLAGRNN